MSEATSNETTNKEIIDLVEQLRAHYPEIQFIKSDHFRWSPEENTIFYNPESRNPTWSLFHETGHMLCDHKSYSSDIGLIKMEVLAWQKACEICLDYGLKIDEKYIEKCLDSYREWMYKRSSCPVCTQAGVEQTTGTYTCINCQKQWHVTSERFCRVYRKTVTRQNPVTV